MYVKKMPHKMANTPYLTALHRNSPLLIARGKSTKDSQLADLLYSVPSQPQILR